MLYIWSNRETKVGDKQRDDLVKSANGLAAITPEKLREEDFSDHERETHHWNAEQHGNKTAMVNKLLPINYFGVFFSLPSNLSGKVYDDGQMTAIIERFFSLELW